MPESGASGASGASTAVTSNSTDHIIVIGEGQGPDNPFVGLDDRQLVSRFHALLLKDAHERNPAITRHAIATPKARRLVEGAHSHLRQ